MSYTELKTPINRMLEQRQPPANPHHDDIKLLQALLVPNSVKQASGHNPGHVRSLGTGFDLAQRVLHSISRRQPVDCCNLFNK